MGRFWAVVANCGAMINSGSPRPTQQTNWISNVPDLNADRTDSQRDRIGGSANTRDRCPQAGEGKGSEEDTYDGRKDTTEEANRGGRMHTLQSVVRGRIGSSTEGPNGRVRMAALPDFGAPLTRFSWPDTKISLIAARSHWTPDNPNIDNCSTDPKPLSNRPPKKGGTQAALGSACTPTGDGCSQDPNQ